MRRVSRRRVLAGGAALAVMPLAARGARPAAYSGAAHVRFDATSAEGQAMLAKFARAVKLMRARDAGDPLSWTFQWYTHWIRDDTTKDAEVAKLPEDQQPLARDLWNSCRAHDHSMDERLFLPWHRAFVYFFERIARTVLDDDSFTLPYWDLTDPQKRALPAAFLQPANDSNPLWCAERKPEAAAGQPIDFRYDTSSPINADALDQDAYAPTDVTQGMCMAIDKGVHSSVHVLTGTMKGMGAVPWAASDPIFWLLHTSMDRLWESWRAGRRADPDGDDWLNAEFAFADEHGQRVSSHVRDFLDLAALGYRYDTLGPTALAGGAVPQPPEPEQAPETSAAPAHHRAARPGTTGAAPPPTAGAEAPPTAAAPPALAQAAPPTEAPASQMARHGPVQVGQGATRVPLNNTAPTLAAPAPPDLSAPPGNAAPSGGGPRAAAPPRVGAAAPRPSKLYIVIRNLQAKAQPGVLYDVFVKVTAPDGRTANARLGSINFFDAVDHKMGDHGMGGMTMQQSFVSFEVTERLALARVPGAKLDVTIAPAGTPAAGAAAVIGEITLVEKPG